MEADVAIHSQALGCLSSWSSAEEREEESYIWAREGQDYDGKITETSDLS